MLYLFMLPIFGAPAAILGLACGGSSGPGPATSGADGSAEASANVDGAPAGDPQAACTAYATVVCQRLDACTNGRSAKVRFADQQACISRTAIGCAASLAAADTSATPAFFQGCASAIPPSTCADFIDQTNTPAACLSAAGPRENGRACSFNGQCKSTWCWTLQGASCGVCADRPAAGAKCATDADCGGRGLGCTRALVCAAPVLAGGACDDAHECGFGTACVGQTPTAAGKCVANVTTLGGACDYRRETGPACQFATGLFCALQGACEAEQPAIGGQPCGRLLAPDAGAFDAGGTGAGDGGIRRPYVIATCMAGGVCVPVGAASGTCSAPAADDGACDRDNGPPCLAPARCVAGDGGTSGKCVLPGATACQ